MTPGAAGRAVFVWAVALALGVTGCAKGKPGVRVAAESTVQAAESPVVSVAPALVAGSRGPVDPRAPMPAIQPTERLALMQSPPPEKCGKPLVVFAEPVREDMLQTPSSAYIEAAGVADAFRARGWEPMTSCYAAPAVPHGALYFQDPFEDKQKISGCGYTGWTWEDFLAIPYSDGRWLLNTIALPISLVVQPPWARLCSDGEVSRQALGYDHDPARTAVASGG